MQQTGQKWPYSAGPGSLAGNTGVSQFITSVGVEPVQPRSGVAWPGLCTEYPPACREHLPLQDLGSGLILWITHTSSSSSVHESGLANGSLWEIGDLENVSTFLERRQISEVLPIFLRFMAYATEM